jgi:hypothetical protein
MGKIGSALGRLAGGALGNWAGKRFKKYTGVDENRGKSVGESIGGQLGELLPFKKGGRVKRTGPIYAHKGEFILPKGVPPTKKQKAKVAKGKRRKRR